MGEMREGPATSRGNRQKTGRTKQEGQTKRTNKKDKQKAPTKKEGAYMMREGSTSDDGLFAVRSDGDDGDRGFKLLLEEINVVLELLRELVFGGDFREVGVPPRHFLVDRCDALVNVVREVTSDSSVLELVLSASLDGGERVEHVALHHDELGRHHTHGQWHESCRPSHRRAP